MTVTVEKTETGKFVIVRRIQQVFNYLYDDEATALEIAIKLSQDKVIDSGNWQHFEDRGDIIQGATTKGTACNKNPSVNAWFVHIIPVNRM
jgi:hypothetical protein